MSSSSASQQAERALTRLHSLWHQHLHSPAPLHSPQSSASSASFQRLSSLLSSDVSLVVLHLPSLPLPVLHRHISTVLDVLDHLLSTDNAPSSSFTPYTTSLPLLSSLLAIALHWAVNAKVWIASVGLSHPSYPALLQALQEGYTRVGAIAEQWIAELSLAPSSSSSSSSSTASSTDPPSPALPALLTLLACSLPVLSPATAQADLSLILAHLRSPSLCRLLVTSSHLPSLLFAIADSHTADPTWDDSRIRDVSDAVLDVWRSARQADRGGTSTAVPCPPYSHHTAVMAFYHQLALPAMKASTSLTASSTHSTLSALLRSIRQHHRVLSAVSGEEYRSISLILVFALLGVLQAMDPKADGVKAMRTTATAIAASSTPPSDPTNPFDSADLLKAIVGDLEAHISRLLPIDAADTGEAQEAGTSSPAFAGSFDGILSAAVVYAASYLPYSAALLRFHTSAFLRLIDSRWCAAGPEQRVWEWKQSPHFALLPHYCRAFSQLLLQAPTALQEQALDRVRLTVQAIHHKWRAFNLNRTLQRPPTKGGGRDEKDDPPLPSALEGEDGEERVEEEEEPTPPRAPPSAQAVKEVQQALFLCVCMALASVSQGSAQLSSLSVPAVCAVVDTLSYVEFCRVPFTAYRDVIRACMDQGLAPSSLQAKAAQSAVDAGGEGRGESTGSDRKGWLQWLTGWAKKKADAQTLSDAAQSRPTDSADMPSRASQVVQLYLTDYLSLPSSPLAAPPAPSSTSPLSPSLVADGFDLVGLSRHFFLLDLLTVWSPSIPSSTVVSTLLPYASSFLTLPIRGIQKRAHTLLTRSLSTLAGIGRSAQVDPTGQAVLRQAVPVYVELLMQMYPTGVAFTVVMDGLLMVYHLLPADDPRLLQASAVVCERLRGLIGECRAGRWDGVEGGMSDQAVLPTSLRHLLILHLQLLQLLWQESFRTALHLTAALFDGEGKGERRGVGDEVAVEVLVLMREVISRNFDLYKRDEAVLWWMAQKERLGVHLPLTEPMGTAPAVPLPLPPPPASLQRRS